MNITTYRGGHPSASSFYRYKNCPGSFLLGQGLESKGSDEAKKGNIIHERMASGEYGFDDLRQECEELGKLEQEAIETTIGESDLSQREKRAWLLENGNPVYSGQVDVVHVVHGNRTNCLVIDYKTGHESVDSADANAQIMALCVLVWDRIILRYGEAQEFKVYGSIIGPHQQPKISTVCYDYQAYKSARSACIDIVESLFEKSNEYNSGDWCKYCAAKSICPAIKKELITMESLPVAKTITNEELSAVIKKLPVIDGYSKDLKAEAKERLKFNPDCLPGLRLKPGTNRREVTNPTQCYRRAIDLGVENEQFMECVKIQLGELKKTIGQVTGKKGKSLDETLAIVLDGIVEAKQSEPSIEIV